MENTPQYIEEVTRSVCESFNSKLRDELLNGEMFYSLAAWVVIEDGRKHYKTGRPQSSLGYKPPALSAVIWSKAQSVPATPATPDVADKPPCINFHPGPADWGRPGGSPPLHQGDGPAFICNINTITQ